LLHGRPRRGHRRTQSVRGARNGRGRPCPGLHRHRYWRTRKPGGGARRGPDRRRGPRSVYHVLSRGGTGSALPHRRPRAAGASGRPLRTRLIMNATLAAAASARPMWWTLAWIIPITLLLIAAPLVIDPFQTLTLTYGLIAAIGALGFNLLLGY